MTSAGDPRPKDGNPRDPRWLRWCSRRILEPLLPREWREPLIGDLWEEWTTEIVPKLGCNKAQKWLWRQILLTAGAALAFHVRRISPVHKILLTISVTLGLFAAFVDSRPNWDDTGILALAILLASTLLGAIGRTRPWLWALGIGLWIPLYNIVAKQTFASLLALVFAFAGAYLGAGIRKLLARSSSGPPSNIAAS